MTENFVSLKERFGNEIIFIDTVGKAVNALDELGLCMNYAVLTKLSWRRGLLVYQGWVYRRTYERYVELPFSEDAEDFEELFTNLLRDIFKPFVLNSTYIQSVIKLTPILSENGCFFVSLLLNFEEEGMFQNVFETLDKVDDSKYPVSSTFFALD
jgi:hypothetical protein